MRMSNKPTRGTPLTEDELKVPRGQGGKGWQAGARFVWVSHFGSKSSNNEKSIVKHTPGPKPPAGTPRHVIVPRWARKYAARP